LYLVGNEEAFESRGIRIHLLELFLAEFVRSIAPSVFTLPLIFPLPVLCALLVLTQRFNAVNLFASPPPHKKKTHRHRHTHIFQRHTHIEKKTQELLLMLEKTTERKDREMPVKLDGHHKP
jgi:hypothetical protein